MLQDDIYDHFVQNGCYKMGTKVDLPRRLHDLVSFVTCGFMVWLPTIYYLKDFIMHPSTTFMVGAAVTTITGEQISKRTGGQADINDI